MAHLNKKIHEDANAENKDEEEEEEGDFIVAAPPQSKSKPKLTKYGRLSQKSQPNPRHDIYDFPESPVKSASASAPAPSPWNRISAKRQAEDTDGDAPHHLKPKIPRLSQPHTNINPNPNVTATTNAPPQSHSQTVTDRNENSQQESDEQIARQLGVQGGSDDSASNDFIDVEEDAEEIEDYPDEDEDAEEADDHDDEDERWMVETILDCKINPAAELYLKVKWENFDRASDMTWEPEHSLRSDIPEMLHAYYKGLGGRFNVLSRLIDRERKGSSAAKGTGGVRGRGRSQKAQGGKTSAGTGRGRGAGKGAGTGAEMGQARGRPRKAQSGKTDSGTGQGRGQPRKAQSGGTAAGTGKTS